MKTYKDFEKEYIGESDVAVLTMVGMTEECLTAQILHFGGDDAYSAYIVDEPDVEIGKHYSQVASFKTWLKIYDDKGLAFEVYSPKIDVYTAGEYGCIIHLH